MADILLLNPAYRGRSQQRSIPHGLLAAGASLKTAGHRLRLIDFHLENDTPHSAMDRISTLRFDMVGISGISTAYSFWKAFMAMFRDRYGSHVPVMAGGSVASTMPETFLTHVPVDAICTGEAEPVVNELAARLLDGRSLNGLNGIGYMEGSETLVRPGVRVSDMDTEVPLPAYDLIDLHRYRWKNWDIDRDILEIVLFSSRGCPYRCFFCSRNFGRRFTQHSTDFFLAHVRHVVARYAPDRLCFSDELFTLNRSWVLDFLDKYRSSGIGVSFRINSRVNTIDRDILLALKNAGCCDIGFGIESGSETILKAMNKQVTVDQNRAALIEAKAVGLNATLTIVLGMPGETRETIAETRRFLIQTDVKQFGCFFATAYPESDLFDFALKKGYITDIDAYMQTVDNADRLVINYTRLDDATLVAERSRLLLDVASAWHRRRGFFSVLAFFLQPVISAWRIARDQGLGVLWAKSKSRFIRERRP